MLMGCSVTAPGVCTSVEEQPTNSQTESVTRVTRAVGTPSEEAQPVLGLLRWDWALDEYNYNDQWFTIYHHFRECIMHEQPRRTLWPTGMDRAGKRVGLSTAAKVISSSREVSRATASRRVSTAAHSAGR